MDGFRMDIPKEGQEIMRRLALAGHECFAVGGCVRDAALGRRCDDIDFASSAEPEETIAALKGIRAAIIPTGIKHGTITVAFGRRKFEITAYRVDGGYSDGRRPDGVTYTKTLTEDLKRRDFTVNAMAYNAERGLIDEFGGLKDLRAKVIRCVGEPKERFGEDYLRMARAYRFAAVLGFELDKGARAAAVELRHNLNNIAAERVSAEFNKLLMSDNFPAIEMFLEDFAEVVLPEVAVERGVAQENKYHVYDVYNHSLAVLRSTPHNLPLRLAAILHDTGKPLVKTVDSNGTAHFKGHEAAGADIAVAALKRLKYDNAAIDTVGSIIMRHDDDFFTVRSNIKRLLNSCGVELSRLIIEFVIADTKGKSEVAIAEKLPRMEAVRAALEETISSGEAYEIKALAVNGGDVMRVGGIKPGKEVGAVLNRLLDAVIDEPGLNERETLLGMIGDILREERHEY